MFHSDNLSSSVWFCFSISSDKLEDKLTEGRTDGNFPDQQIEEPVKKVTCRHLKRKDMGIVKNSENIIESVASRKEQEKDN